MPIIPALPGLKQDYQFVTRLDAWKDLPKTEGVNFT